MKSLYNKDEIFKKLKSSLKPDRFTHTLGVRDTALYLSHIHGANEEKAEIAALLHDCGKSLSTEERFAICKKYSLPVNEAEQKNPSLLHAKCGAVLAKTKYGVNDPEILHAICVHTTGEPDMSLLDHIIYVSDYIEPNRFAAPRLDELRALAERDLEYAVYIILSDTIKYLNTRHAQAMDPMTQKAFEFYAYKYKDFD